MENNKLCNWLLYYSKQDTKVINSENIIDIENTVLVRQKLCSSIGYFESGSVLFDDFPDSVSGFAGIFEYLMNDRGSVMEKMKSDDQRLYINKLSDCNNFSIRHHVSIIKCIMKCYVCRLAPWDRIKRALDSLGSSQNIDDTRSLPTFRQTQQNLIIWLKEAATKGLLRLMKKAKNCDEAHASAVINNSTLGSLVLYTMLYYTQTKMIKYNVTMPDYESRVNNNSSKSNVSVGHSRIVMTAFADICDNVDILPLQSDCLLSTAVDTVPSALVIALTFHWTFGNSLKNLENLLRSSYSSTNSSSYDKSPSSRPSDLPILNKPNDTQDRKPFFMNNNQSSNDSLHQIFAKGKNKSGVNDVNGTSRCATDGDTSPEIFLTPTEEEIPTSFIKSVTPPIKLLSYKTVDTTPKSLNNNSNNATPVEPICLNLKEKFQKKRKEELGVEKTKPKVNILSINETTWMAQSNKNDTIPLTPKKGSKQVDAGSQNGSTQTLTKGQLSDIQIQLSLPRKKIESSKKDIAKKTEKSLESHKQKAFFQAFDKGVDVTRRKSLELEKGTVHSDTQDGDRRLSMFVDRSDKVDDFYPAKNLLTKELLESFAESPIKDSSVTQDKNGYNDSKCQEYNSNEMDPPQSSQIVNDRSSPLGDSLNRTTDVVSGNRDEDGCHSVSLCDPPGAGLPTKNSSPSISSLSSASDLSIDKNHVTKDEYQKSIDLLSTSLTNLQEEIRFLSQQQLSWNSKISHPLKPVDTGPQRRNSGDKKLQSESNSVAETPTNMAFSLTDVTELQKNDFLIQRIFSVPTTEVESSNEISQVIHPSSEMSLAKAIAQVKIRNRTSPVIDISPSSQMSSPTDVSPEYNFPEYLSRKSSLNKTNSIDKLDNVDVMLTSNNEPTTDDEVAEMSSSSESVKVTNNQPVSFIIAEDKNNEEALRKKAELLAKREQRRLLKLEMYRQRREQDRENRLSAANEELLERELKKKLEQEKRDSLLKKYLDRRNEESAPAPVKRSSSTAGTPVKSLTKSQTLKPSVRKSVKPDSEENLSLASSPQRNGWFSSMRQNHRMTSSSTSQLDTNIGMSDSGKFGVPLPPQEYMGPKLFGKRKVKTNRSVIANAIAHCCLAGSVNIPIKEAVLKELADAEGTHFMILFRDSRCQYRSLYVFDLNTEDLNLIVGAGPKKVTHEMVEKFYKYNSGAKIFNPILSTKHLSPAVDAICIQSVYWNTRPTSQLLSGAVSTSSISQTKTKRLLL